MLVMKAITSQEDRYGVQHVWRKWKRTYRVLPGGLERRGRWQIKWDDNVTIDN